MSVIIIRQPDYAEYEVVKKYIDLFRLDKSYMRRGQFRILLFNGVVAAFARLKEHSGCKEICSLGVVKKLRGRHLGMTLLNGILAGMKCDVYLVTVEPRYFKKIGFRIAGKYPAIMRKKCEKCRIIFPVGKAYRVMIHRWKRTTAM